MKVLHVELGRHLYGGARQVAYLLNGLAHYPGEHVLICPPGAGVAAAVRGSRARVRPVSMGGDLDITFALRLARLLWEEKADLLHLHSRKGDLPTILAGRLAGLPVVYSRRVDNPPNWADLRLKFPRCARVVTISQGIRDVLVQSGVAPERIRCIPSAVDTGAYRPGGDKPAFRAEFGLPDDAVVVGMVAQLIPRKGHMVLFEALRQVCPGFPRLRVLIFGQGPLAAELRRTVQDWGLADCVRFAGFRHDLERILPCLDVLAHPAWMEGLGVTLLEAAACGVPILASEAGGMPEIVEDGMNGFLIEPGDSDALANRLTRLLADPELARAQGLAGRRIVLERFAIDRMVEGNYRLYEEMVS